MDSTQKKLLEWNEDVLNYHLPRWEELPDLELYRDQVIYYIEQNVQIFSDDPEEKILTPSMINNYVKLKLIPKPVKKRYNKVHLAYLIAICILKQVVTIEEIRDGIIFQAQINGRKNAYNLFCEEQEKALKSIMNQIISGNEETISDTYIHIENLTVKMATMAFASKTIAEKTVKLQKNFINNKEGGEEDE